MSQTIGVLHLAHVFLCFVGEYMSETNTAYDLFRCSGGFNSLMWLYLIFKNEQKGSDEIFIVSTASSRLW